jgi:pimeloyl-ACP methyl ester carboxylesterase
MEKHLHIDDLKISYKHYGDIHSSNKILCLHGFQDNLSTFDNLAPLLVSNNNYQLISMDFEGHGHSDHYSKQTDYLFFFRVRTIFLFLEILNWKNIILIGHSMGANVAIFFAGTFPNLIKKLILIEGIGAINQNYNLPETFEKNIIFYQKTHNRKPNLYNSKEEMVKKYMKKVNYIKKENAIKLIDRGSEEVKIDSKIFYKFKHDTQLIRPTTHKILNQDILSFIQRINCPTLLIIGKESWLNNYLNSNFIKERMKTFVNLESIYLNGNHHLHLDNAEDVYNSLIIF